MSEMTGYLALPLAAGRSALPPLPAVKLSRFLLTNNIGHQYVVSYMLIYLTHIGKKQYTVQKYTLYIVTQLSGFKIKYTIQRRHFDQILQAVVYSESNWKV